MTRRFIKRYIAMVLCAALFGFSMPVRTVAAEPVRAAGAEEMEEASTAGISGETAAPEEELQVNEEDESAVPDNDSDTSGEETEGTEVEESNSEESDLEESDSEETDSEETEDEMDTETDQDAEAEEQDDLVSDDQQGISEEEEPEDDSALSETDSDGGFDEESDDESDAEEVRVPDEKDMTAPAAEGKSGAKPADEKRKELALRANSNEITTWSDLQAALNDGRDCILTHDITAAQGDGPLVLELSHTMTIDLNGYEINRGLSDSGAISNGYVIQIWSGELTITDSRGSGKITGGNNLGNGGGVSVQGGEFILTGGSITDNSSTGNGGGVYVDSGTFTLADGNITGNRGSNGGGIYVCSGSTLDIYGGSITDNTAGSSGGGIYSNGTCNISSGSGITIDNNSADGDNVTDNLFLANQNSDKLITVDSASASGSEILVSTQYSVTFDKGRDDAQGTMEAQSKDAGSKYKLPTCGFTVPGMEFKEWSVKIGNAQAVLKNPEDEITVSANTVVTAIWKKVALPEFSRHALLLTEQIGVQFYLALPNGKTAVDYPNSYVTFEGNKIDPDAQYALSSATTVDGKYEFIVFISSIQMADKFTPIFHYKEKDGNSAKDTESWKTIRGEAYSAEDYINWALTGTKGKNLEIVETLADYGYYAQPYLSALNGWSIGSSYAAMTTHVTGSYNYDAVAAAASEYKAKKKLNDNITKITYKMWFDSEITLRIILTPGEGVRLNTVSVDGSAVTPEKSGNTYYVDITGIKASELASTHIIEAKGARTDVSPMSYVYSILTGDNNTDAKNLMCALYYYAQACK